MNAFLILICLFLLLLLIYTNKVTHNELSKLYLNNNQVQFFKVLVTRSWINSRTGLLNHISLGKNEGLMFGPSKSVHTKGMNFPIDIIFLDKDGVVLNIIENVPSNLKKVIKGPRKSYKILELRAHVAKNILNLKVGDNIKVG